MVATVVLALVSPVVAVFIAIWGFRSTSKSDRLRAFFELQERYLAHEVRVGRRLMHASVAGRTAAEIEALPQQARESIGYALAVLNSIAIACEGGYAAEDMVERSMGRSFAGAVAAAKPYIDALERQRGFRPYPFAERLAARYAAHGGPVAAAAAAAATGPAPPEGRAVPG